MAATPDRVGMTQVDRVNPALSPDFVSVEERTLLDHLHYIRDYAKKVRFYDEESEQGSDDSGITEAKFWTHFLDFSNDELLDMLWFANDPQIFDNQPAKRQLFNKPHYVLLLTFLQLLQYSGRRFAQLTEKHLQFFYQQCLQIKQRGSVADRAHLIVTLADTSEQYALAAGTVFSGSKDGSGEDVRFELAQDIVLNQAQLTDVRVVQFAQNVTNLKTLHESFSRGNGGFEAILKVAMGGVEQFPDYIDAYGQGVAVDARFLGQTLAPRMRYIAVEDLSETDRHYVGNELGFHSIKDGVYCLDLLYREQNRGYRGVTRVHESEWEQLYVIFSDLHREHIARERRRDVRDIHRRLGVLGMFEWLFGEPEPGHRLFAMPNKDNALSTLANNETSAAHTYIEEKLCLQVDDFKSVYARIENQKGAISWQEVYILLEQAWAKKRQFTYPSIDQIEIKGIARRTLYDGTEEFMTVTPFAEQADAAGSAIDMGVMLSSWTLAMQEGLRKVDVFLHCKANTLPQAELQPLLNIETGSGVQPLFHAQLSTQDGWQEASEVNCALGDFIYGAPVSAFTPEEIQLIGQLTAKLIPVDNALVGQYLLLDGGYCYRIDSVDSDSRELNLVSSGFTADTQSHRLIREFTPSGEQQPLLGSLSFYLDLNTDNDGVLSSTVETFNENHEGLLATDAQGNIYALRGFISAKQMTVTALAALSPQQTDAQWLNRIWLNLTPTYDNSVDLSSFIFTGVRANRQTFSFAIAADKISLAFPENSTSEEIISAWKIWQRQSNNDAGRFQIKPFADSTTLAPLVGELQSTNLVMKRYQSASQYGPKVCHFGRQNTSPSLTITPPQIDQQYTAAFVVAGDELIITPGSTTALTANQLAAQWSIRAFYQDSAFTLESTDDRIWAVPPLSEAQMQLQDRQVKFADIVNEYGNGLRIRYIGAIAEQASIILRENTIDRYDFEITEDLQLTVYYPSTTPTLGGSLVSAWQQWSADALNDRSGFDIILQGEDVYTINGIGVYVLDEMDNQAQTKSAIIDDNGFQVTYIPALHPNKKANGRVLLIENDKPLPEGSIEHTFEFAFKNDELKDFAELQIFYPSDPKLRTIENLLSSWLGWNEGEHTKFENDVYPSFQLTAEGKGTWEVGGQTYRQLKVRNDTFYEFTSDGKPNLHIEYRSDQGGQPSINTQVAAIDEFEVEITEVDGVAQNLLIRYPEDPSLCTITRFYQAWLQLEDHAGFTISDDSAPILARRQAPLLSTGNVMKARHQSGLAVEYIGPEQDVFIDMQPLEAFSTEHIGQTLVWSNGKRFTLVDRLDPHNLLIEAESPLALTTAIGIYKPEQIHPNAIHVQCELSFEFPPVVPLLKGENQAEEKDQLEQPAIKLTLNNDFSLYPGSADPKPKFLYTLVNSVELAQASVYVDVEGLGGLAAYNNQDNIDPQSPFAPFATRPQQDAPFYFAHREICGKPLDSLQVNFHWQALIDPQTFVSHSPPKIESYYAAYFQADQNSIGDTSAMDFRLDVDFYQNNRWHALPMAQDRLFEEHISLVNLQDQNFNDTVFGDDDLGDNPLSWPFYYRLRLRQDMLNNEYARVEKRIGVASQRAAVASAAYDAAWFNLEHHKATVKANAVAAATARAQGLAYFPAAIPEPKARPNVHASEQEIAQLAPPLPYTPQLNALSVNYRASAHIFLSDQVKAFTEPRRQQALSLYRYHPFGIRPMGLALDSDDYLLPFYDKQGYLYIGLSRCQPGQLVSILFQLLSGSGAQNVGAPEVAWQYLASHHWQPFPANKIIKDTSSGLQDSGLIEFLLPDDLSLAHTLMPSGKGWIRAEYANNLAALPDIVTIKTQAVEVQFLDHNNDPSRLGKPLAAHSLNTLEQPVADVVDVSQPYTSFGGLLSEAPQGFDQRVSELLHNKGRALTYRDYESALLSSYPQLQKVKCLPIRDMAVDARAQSSELDLLLIAVIKNQDSEPFLPARPNVPVALLKKMQVSIDSIKPATVKIQVQNPQFEEVTFRLAVKFHAGREKGFHANALNQAITRFLSPWAYEEGAAFSVGNTIYSAAVIHFIEGLDYVDYVARFTLLRQIIRRRTHDEVLPLFLTQAHGATAKYPDAVLVASDNHVIDVIDDNLYDADAFKGIGHMQIGSDFWLARPGAIFDVGIGRMEIDELQVPKTLFTTIEGGSSELSAQIWQRLHDNAYLDVRGNLLSAFNPDKGLSGFSINGTIRPADLEPLGLDSDALWATLLAQSIVSADGEVLVTGSQIENDILALPQPQFEQLRTVMDRHFSTNYAAYQAPVYAALLARLDFHASQYPYLVY